MCLCELLQLTAFFLCVHLCHSHYRYCGHGTGREFLATDHFQLLGCQATTLLMGCGSGRLVVGGVCDPAGMALTYLLAGW